MRESQSKIQNGFLRALSPEDFALLSADLTSIDLPRRMVLSEENRPIPHVYFPEQGLASIVALQPDREMIEVGCFGFEGLSDPVHDPGRDKVPLRTLMQVPGSGWRMEAAPFAEAMHASGTFLSIVLRHEQ